MSYNPQNSNGQATSANSSPVVVASDQSTLPTNLSQVAGTTTDTNSGNKSAGTQRVVIATDQPQLTNALKVDGSAVTQPVSIAAGASTVAKAEDAAHSSGDVGTFVLGVRETTPTDLSANNADGDYEPFQVSRDGALWVSGAASHKGGWSVATGTIGATATNVGTANTAGQVGGWYIFNPNSSVAYVQFFNTQASGVTLGTTSPVYSLGIPAASAANIAPGMVGINHSTAISIGITTTRSGSTGPSSTVDYNIWYKQ